MATGPRGSKGPGRGTSSGPSARARTGGRGGPKAKAAPSGAGGSRFTTRALVLLVVMVLLIASYTASLHTWWQQRQEIRATEAEIEWRKTQIAELTDDAQRWDDPAFIAQQARERFGWVLPGEVGYRVLDADGEVEGDGPQLTEPEGDLEPTWYGQLWESVEVAGLEQVATPNPVEVPDVPLGQEPSE